MEIGKVASFIPTFHLRYVIGGQIARQTNLQPLISKRGFTLIELSVVIVIIGLIVAGIVAGQSLVKQAKLRAVIADFNKINQSINTFELQYDALPGDISNFNSYFSGSPVGDGNGALVRDSADLTENLYFWQHLASAGFIDGVFTHADQGSPSALPGVSVLASPISNAGYFMSDAYESPGLFGVTSGTVVSLTNFNTGDDFGSVLSALDAQIIDLKMDDGLPALGIVFTDRGAGGTPCVSENRSFTGDPATVSYSLSVDTIECRLWFWIDKPR